MSDLPTDREKALERIAAGWGRTATAAHPLCRCADQPGRPAFLPPCQRCGADQNEKCRQPGSVCGKTSSGRYARRVREHLGRYACPVHA